MDKKHTKKDKIWEIKVEDPVNLSDLYSTKVVKCQFPECQCFRAEGVVPVCDKKNTQYEQ